MATLADQVIAVAESQIGVHESPMGSNRGGCEKYQLLYGQSYLGCLWCGCFQGWVWAQVDPSWKSLASPSTADACKIADEQGLHCPPSPGAAFVICGTHVGLLHSDLGGGSWRTIEGNHGDQVAWSTRALDGMTIYAPPGLGERGKPEQATWYFLQDTELKRADGRRAYYGGWSSSGARDERMATLETSLGHELRPFRDDHFSSPFFIDNSFAIAEVYGGWSVKGSRDEARETLEARLGRPLRPFSETRDAAIGGVPWGCENLA
jgi:hypothetical protein